MSNLRVGPHSNAVNAEIKMRRIRHEGELEEMEWRQRKNLLKEHELGELAKCPGRARIGGKAMQVSDVKDIVPVSDELRALMPERAEAKAQRRNK